MNYQASQKCVPDISLIYKTVDGLHLPMRVFYPAGGIHGKHTTVLCIHGGGWHAYEKDELPWQGCWMKHQANYYAMQGYVGIEISYRSITLENVNVFDLIEDCKDAMEYVKTNFDFVDPNKVIVTGDSAGGHLVLALAHSSEAIYQPWITLACNPVTDCTDERFSYLGNPDELKNASPLFFNTPPHGHILVIHGTKDQVVPFETAYNYQKKMKELGGDVTLLPIEGAKHAFILFGYQSTDEQASSYMTMIDEYLKQYI